MKHRILLLLAGIMVPFLFFGQTIISTNITSNTTLTIDNSPYIITSSITVNPGITLTIENGVEIRFNQNISLQVRGEMLANGVVFTANGSSTKGFWDGIYVSNETFEEGSITLDNCSIEYAKFINIRKGQLSINNSLINNFSSYGIQISSQGILNIDNTTISNTDYPLCFNGPGVINPGTNVVFSDNTNNFIYLNFSNISTQFHLKKLTVPYYFSSEKRIQETGSLIIDPGVELNSNNGRITVNGTIKASGTKDEPVIFDKFSTSSYWYGIQINNIPVDSVCEFSNCIFRNARYSFESGCAVGIIDASPVFDSCQFSDNYYNLVINGRSNPKFSNCVFGPSVSQGNDCYNIIMDPNANPEFLSDSIQFNSTEIRAIKLKEGNIVSDSRLKKISFIGLENISYYLTGTITVADTASLHIDPGIVIKCYSYYTYSGITANGSITAIGTVDEPIIFTHIADDNYGNPRDSQNDGVKEITNGTQSRIILNSTSTSVLENWKINYIGYASDYSIYVNKANILKDCEIKNSNRGVCFSNDAQIINNSFVDIKDYPVARIVNQGTPVLLGNTVSNVGNTGILLAGFADDNPVLKPLNFTGFTTVAYIIDNLLTINSGNIVSIDPGVVLKFTIYGGIVVNGGLKAIGRADNKIIFTSIHDDSALGDTNNNGTATTPDKGNWRGIDFAPMASDNDNILKNCEFRYVGYYSAYGSVCINSCRVIIDSTLINFSNTNALAILGDANPEISNCKFYNLDDAPVYMDLFSNPVFSGSNSLVNVSLSGISIRGGELSGTIPIRSFAGIDTITYILKENITVRDQLVIPAGLTFKGNSVWNVRGKLNIQGTAQHPVVFTTFEDDAFGNPRDLQQNGNTKALNNGNYFIFHDESDDNSVIDHAIFRYSYRIPVQLNNSSPTIQNTTFENLNYEGISLQGTSQPTINNCIFNNISYPFTTSLVTYPASTSANVISGTTGRAIRVTNETLTNDASLIKRNFAGIENIPYVFHNYTVGTGAVLTINPGVILKFRESGSLDIKNGLIAIGGASPDSTIVFTSDVDDFYGGDTYADGDSDQGSLTYWSGIYFYNESIDDNCILKNCILKNGSYFLFAGYTNNRGVVTLDNASPTIEDCLFKENHFAILSKNISFPKINSCDFNGTHPTQGYAVYNMATGNTLTATNCWWNSATGPRHSSNPEGTGERVSDNVVFTPFATQLFHPVLGDVSLNGTITPFDASLILQHTVSNIVLTPKQLAVADVSGNGNITSYDASLILQYCVGLINRFEASDKKSVPYGNAADISFSDIQILQDKKTFHLPVNITTASSIKSLEMNYLYDNQHLRFLGLNFEQLPSDIMIETGKDIETGRIAISLASAYDLNFNGLTFFLEFEFADLSIDHSTLRLTNSMANEYPLNTENVYLMLFSEDFITGIRNPDDTYSPLIFYRQQAINIEFMLKRSGSSIDIQISDLSGRLIYRNILKGLDQGSHSIELPFMNSGDTKAGIYIIRLRSDEFNHSQKLLIN